MPRLSRPKKIFAGFAVGAVTGVVCHLVGAETAWLEFVVRNVAQPVGQIFLRLIFMIVVPLVFASLVLGVYELGDLRRLGRVGFFTLAYTVIASGISVAIGLGLVNLIEPGRGLDPALLAKHGLAIAAPGESVAPAPVSDLTRLEKPDADTARAIEQAKAARGLGEILVSLIPKNPLAAAVSALEGEMVALMVFAVLFGIALALARPNAPDDSLVGMLSTLRDVSMKVVDMAMAVAPFGVAGLIFAMTARFGWTLLGSLGQYVLVVVLGLAAQQLIVYSLILKFFTRFSPGEFLGKTREVMLTAFSTSSSNATLPTSLRVAEENLGLDRGVSSFVLTVGATANQNGTALFEGVTILFLAQVFGIELSLGQQLTVVLMSIVAGIGTAGVPGGSLPMIVLVMQSVGVPAEGIGLILGVDRFLDMCRTTLNVTGDLVAACVIEKNALPPGQPPRDSLPASISRT